MSDTKIRKLYDDCPACFRQDTRVRLAIHLMEYHHWTYTRGMDWLRTREESA